MSLTPEQTKIIRATVPVLQQHGNAITSSFYDTLLKEVPELNNVFNQANQRGSHQAKALAGALYAYAANIDDLGVLAPALEKICHKHASLYITPAQYEVVGTYLLRAMGDVLGSALTPDILEAWGAAYWQLAKIMIKKEEDLLRKAGSWTDWRDFKITDKVRESEEITSFYLRPVDGETLPAFLPGQYVSILTHVPRFGYMQSRQYSLSDAPREDYYRISVKKEGGLTGQVGEEAHPGFMSNVLHDEKHVGDVVKMSHPAGEFFLHPEQDTNGPVVLLSAGVGLTPMVSILNTLVKRDSGQRISFVHGSRTTKTQAFRRLLQDTIRRHPKVTSSVFIKSPDTGSDIEGLDYKHVGRVSLDALDHETDLLLSDSKTKYFVCGPDAFMTDVHQGLKRLGVDEQRIKLELFGTGDIPSASEHVHDSAFSDANGQEESRL